MKRTPKHPEGTTTMNDVAIQNDDGFAVEEAAGGMIC
jgi:hypothetical protein